MLILKTRFKEIQRIFKQKSDKSDDEFTSDDEFKFIFQKNRSLN